MAVDRSYYSEIIRLRNADAAERRRGGRPGEGK
jgi:hypothetical protein